MNKRGNIHHSEEKVETCFRLVVIKNEKIIIPLLFLSIFILIALVDFVQLLDGFLSIFNDKQNWWLIYQLFENNFSVDQLK